MSTITIVCRVRACTRSNEAFKLPAQLVEKNMISHARIAITLALLLATFAALQFVHTGKPIPTKKSLSELPATIGQWRRIEERALSEKVATMLGVDDYVDYDYIAPDGMRINFYASYFSSVGTTGAYHSPRNCLPGSGWQIASLKEIPMPAKTAQRGDAFINSMIIQNGSEQQLTIYWFQKRGRIIASEYWDKAFLILDSIFERRRDGSFIRIITPLREQNLNETEARLQEFAQAVMVLLHDYLPGAKV